MKEKIKTIIFIIVLIVIGIGVITGVQQYRKFLQEKVEKEFLFTMKQKCREEGNKIYQEDVKHAGFDTMCSPEYSYNKKLNTCLYFSCYIGIDWVNKWVKDVFSNKEILSLMISGGEVLTINCPTCVASEEEFDRIQRELFSQ